MDDKGLTEKQHAILFALWAKEGLARVGMEAGLPVIRKAVRRYGEQRGRRMALRVLRDGRELNLVNFMAYSEWKSATGEVVQELKEEKTDLHLVVHNCPWNSAWRESQTLPYGRLYCLEIDQALLGGYNPQLRLEVESTLSNDGEPSSFKFTEAKAVYAGSLAKLETVRASLSAPTVMSWGYHSGHLYKTLREVFIQELGDAGEQAATAALQAFGDLYGEQAVRVILSYQGVDFDRLPE